MDYLRVYLAELARKDIPPDEHYQYLENLYKQGFRPKVIYDIGSCVLHWTNTAKKFWPDAEYVLFDAFQPAEFLYEGYKYHIGVLSDEDDKSVKFYQNDYFPTGNSYYREIGHPGNLFPEDKFVLKKTRKIDSIVKEYGFPCPDLVKLDVQGAEIDIMNGAVKTFQNAKHMIVEIQHTQYNDGAPLIDVSIPYIESLGWKCVAPLFQNNQFGDYGFTRS
jgi:FkbM family methyltransferase